MVDIPNSPVNIAQMWGFDRQVSEHKQAINFTQNVIGILQEKCELQSTYARGLNRLSAKLKEALTSAPNGTVHSSWSHISNVLESEAKIHQNSALGLLEGLVKPWIDLIEELVKSRKPLKCQVEKATNQFINLSTNELRAKKKLNAAYRACERTWFSHVQSLRSPPKLVKLNGGDVGNTNDPPDVTVSPAPHTPRHQLRAYHSFRDRSSADLTSNSSNSNTLDVTNQRSSLRRHFSARSATLPSPTSTLESSDSSGILSQKITPAVNKTKEACYTALCDYYKAFMSAEEARVEWHTVVLKCLHEQRVLERQRLHAMVNGLTVYQRLVNEAIPKMKTMATELTDALRLADPAADVKAFRQRSHDNMSASSGTDVSTSLPSDQANNDTKQITGIVGRSQQRLLELPGEKNMLQQLLSVRSGQANGDLVSNYRSNGHLSLDRSSNYIQKHHKNPSDFELRGHLRNCLTRECIFDHLDLLTKDVQKERRTKRGLSNLVQVYSLEPAYADAQTLTEARRRLFVSRVRLTHLTNCRQKLLYSLICALPSSQTASDNAPKHIYVDALNRAGFTDLPWTIVTSSVENRNARMRPVATRWVLVPDLDDDSTFNKLTKPLEWPPFPASELSYEDLNDDLFDWELERLRLLDADQRENGLCDPILSLDFANGDLVTCSSLKAISPTVEQNDSSHLTNLNRQVNGCLNDHKTQSIRSSHPSKLESQSSILNNSREKRSTISSIERLRNGNSWMEPENRASINMSDLVTGISDKVAMPRSPTLATQEHYESDGEEQPKTSVPIRRSVSSSRTRLFGFPLTRFRRSTSAVQRAKSFAQGQMPTTPVATECGGTTTTSVTMMTPVSTAVENTSRMSPIAIECDTFSGDSRYSVSLKQNGTISFSSKLLSKIRSSSGESKEDKVNNANSHPTASAQMVSELASVQRFRRNSKNHYLGSRGNTPRCITSTEPTTRVVHFGSVESHDIVTEPTADRSQWSSNLSLHCIGWAKVERSYTAKEPDELTLLEGEVVSIYRKDNNEWWYGEVNGSQGRFPVSHVDEF